MLFCDYFSRLTGYDDIQKMLNDTLFINNCKEFTNRIKDSAFNRNNASHGGTRISMYQCKDDKKTVLSNLEKVRSNNIGLIQTLLYLLQNSK